MFTLENGKISISVKAMGAELASFKRLGDGKEFLWQGNPEIWCGQSPVLFPIVGTLLHNQYKVDGRVYELHRHGIARKRNFILVRQNENFIEFSQVFDDETLKCYPYKYELRIRYTLDENKLIAAYTVINHGEEDMYFSLGAHPGFNCKIGDVLEFECDESEAVDEMIDSDSILLDEIFPSPVDGRIFTITSGIFDKDAHVLSNLKSKKCVLKGKTRDSVEFFFGDAPFLGLWAKPAAEYVCIEPWFGINDSRKEISDFSQKRAIQKISPDENFTYFWSAEIKSE